MAKNEVFVPLLSWLIGGSRIGGSYNIYCASIGTDPMKGCLGNKIFNYRIWIEKLDETEIINPYAVICNISSEAALFRVCSPAADIDIVTAADS